MQPAFKRKRLLVDPHFQFRMLGRMFSYLFVFILLVFHLTFLFEFMLLMANDRLPDGGVGGLYLTYVEQQKFFIASLLLVSPAILYDMLKFSNRFAGPLFRCRRTMREMTAGSLVPEFKPRDNDLMKYFFADFNGLIKEWNARLESAHGLDEQDAPACEQAGAPKNGSTSPGPVTHVPGPGFALPAHS